MSDPLRQRLWDDIKVRFQSIHTNNGYATSIGTKVFPWRDLESMPFTKDEIPCLSMRDADNAYEPGVITKHHFRLTVEVFAMADGSPPDNLARLILADLDRAIGVDRQWSGFATNTIPVSDRIEVVHMEKRLAGVRKTFTVEYRHSAFDHYTP